MPDEVLGLWRQAQNVGANGAGRRRNAAYVTLAQQRAGDAISDILALPVDNTSWQPLGVVDTSDPNFGAFYFNPFYSDPAGDDILR